MRSLLIVTSLIALLAGCSGKKERQLLVGRSAVGTFTESLTATGYLDAINSIDVLAPNFQANSTLIFLVPEGTFVEQGEKIAMYDPGSLQDQLTVTEDKIKTAEFDMENYVASWQETLLSLSNSLNDKEAGMKIQEFSQESLKYAARIDQEKGKLDMIKAQRDLNDAKSKIKMAILNNERVMRTKDDALKKLRFDRGTYVTNIDRCTVVAPKKGLIVYRTKNPYTKEKIKIGDSLRRDQVYMTIPDLERMLVRMEVNEVDIHRIRVGLPCSIVLDAFPDFTYTARITSIGALAHAKLNNNDIQVFDVNAHVSEVDVDRLRPGMSSRIEIIINSFGNVCYIPIDSVFNKKENKGTVFLITRNGLTRQEVELGPKNDDYVIVRSPLPENAEMMLYDPVIEESGFKIGDYDLKAFTPAKQKHASNTMSVPPMTAAERKLRRTNDVAITATPKDEVRAPVDTTMRPKADVSATNTGDAGASTNKKRSFSFEQMKESRPDDYKKIVDYLKRNNMTEDDVKNDRTKMTKMMSDLGLVRKRSTNAAPEKNGGEER